MLKSLTFDEFIDKFVSSTVSFAINLAIAIAIFYIGRWIINKLYRLVHNIFIKRNIDASLSTFVLSMIRIVLYFILIVTVIGILGIETSSFLALFASAGVAIGMALSGTLQNFAGGVLILLLKPYKIGDYIEAQGYSGTVKEIQIFHTIINTPDNKSIIIPNGGLSTGSVNNYSRESFRRVDWVVGISYGDSVDTAREKILAILASDSRTITDEPAREPKVVVNELADSSVNLKVSAWVASADYWGLYHTINERIYNELPEAGINFPFPQLQIHNS
jgi:small conductance mechanosensitive channel